MATRVSPTDLDFASLRAGLRQYLESSGKFSEYDFGGSGLSALLDLLAYNTHLMALVANFTLNEAYLDSAQLRSSVVSLAKPLNYLPRSSVAAKAVVDIAVNGATGPADLILPKHTKFTGSNGNTTYSFYTLDEYVATEAGGYVFRDVVLYEGKLITKRFVVDQSVEAYTIYVVPDQNLYVDSLEVSLQAGLDSTDIQTLVRPTSIADFGPEALIYLVAEAASGYYEITAGDGLMGLQPPLGSILRATYLRTEGPAANGIQSFTTVDTLNGLSLSANTVRAAAGGAPKESITSIKANAPLMFAAQDRAITVDDYKAIISNSVSYVEAISVWGGEMNVPPDYGAAYISIKPFGAEAITQTQEVQLRQLLEGKSALGVRPKFVEPEYQYLELQLDVRYDSNKTLLTKQQLENKIKDAVLAYMAQQLVDFGSVFRRSSLITFIGQIDPSITASNITVRTQRRLMPLIGQLARYDLQFNNPITQARLTGPIITSDTFQYEIEGVSYNCRLRNIGATYDLEIFRSTTGGEVIVVDNVGRYDTSTDTLILLPFGPSGISNASEGIRFSVIPADENIIRPKLNRLIRVDELLTTVTASADE